MVDLQAEQLSVSYQTRSIIEDLSLSFPSEQITTIIGPNGCGKSTLLKSLARLLSPTAGTVYIKGEDLQAVKRKALAQMLGMLSQSPEQPEGLSVYQLVAYGRYPHRKRIGKLTDNDHAVISQSLQDTGLIDFKDRNIEELSGGQRQRAWIAMALAQETDILLLDEPTTYLDMTHQLEILLLLQSLNRTKKRTVIMVLHDLNHASRFSDQLVAMKNGEVLCMGTPEEVVCPVVLRSVFGIEAQIVQDPSSGAPLCMTYDIANPQNIQHSEQAERQVAAT
ncbi:ABC transporter ATP-binding protein [Salsuginibacillus kocurii]|uniref:ABC transporter ATP-binding protein n=1 Tax=Salsuginibacillus kocurii TaxID=427078 RepID=UPI00035CE75D|nr:ABC transporter ATP-binding protein [Salsuginibacillus kocurii]